MFKHAIVRKPSPNMVDGLTASTLGTPDFDKAFLQHQDYVMALIEAGLNVTILDACDDFPDSCFVEDVALMTPACSILTNPGAESRRGEVAHIEEVVETFSDLVERIEAPATIEAGDIMMVGDHYYIGLSDRTDQQGAEQMIAILEKHGLSGSTVSMEEVLHLKTGLSYLENNNLIACGEFVEKAEFEEFNIIEISAKDSYSANCIWVNDLVLVAAGYPSTVIGIELAGYRVREVDMSEFQKLDGGLSCLSLRF